MEPNDDVDDLMELGPVNWRRAGEIPSLRGPAGRLHVVQGKIEPSDILQGEIGDCYFLSSLAGIAEHERRIRDLFCSLDTNEHGVYGANLYKNGIKMQVVIDDKIVCLGDSDEIAFAAAHGPELWVILLEKMWAKIHSCYDRIAGGWEFETIRDLTGAPGYYLTSIEDDTFDLIQEYDRANYIMGCSVKDGYDEDLAEQQGLVCGHAYTLLAVYEFKSKGKEQRLVKLRNPWGSGEWNGNWSDDDKKWTAQLRKDAGFDGGKDDGIFWMSYEDFDEIYG